MSQQNIINAAPMTINRGTQDLSTTQVPINPLAIPQHLPKFYTFAQRGPTTPQLCDGTSMGNIYGVDSFDLRKAYATHVTPFINGMSAQGNMVMLERLIPADAGPASTIVLSLDVLATTVNIYKRNIDGSIALDSTNQPIVIGTASGFKVKWVLSNYSTQTTFGAAQIANGSQTDPATGNVSKVYPIFEIRVSSQGAFGNNCGLRIWAPNTMTSPDMETTLLTEERAYPYYFQVIERSNSRSAPTVQPTVMGSEKVMAVLQPGTIDPLTEQLVYVGNNFIQAYQNLTDTRYPLVFGDFGEMYVYQNNLNTLLAEFQLAEVPYIDSNTDFTSSPTDMYMFNIISGNNSNGMPYNTFQLVDSASSVRLTQYANIYAAGGSDGTLGDVSLDGLVATAVANYADPTNPLMDIAVNVESIMYDSGFTLPTKEAMCSFIAERHDTFIVLSTFTAFAAGGQQLTEAEENSIAISLRTRLQMYPDSTYFGTPVMRGMIMGRNALIRNSLYTDPLPLTYEVAMKSAAYMGAANGKWKSGFNFDGAPGSILQYMYNANISWSPTTIRNRDWDVGLNWVQSFDRNRLFFPALKTVYDNDTSVLNSYFVAMAICQINKITQAAWREFSGVEGLTEAQFAENVNTFVTDNTQGRFDGRYKIIPKTTFTQMDTLRGYSWTLPVEIGANNMETVMTTYVQAYRMADLPSTTNG